MLVWEFIRYFRQTIFKDQVQLVKLRERSIHHSSRVSSGKVHERVSVIVPTRDKPEMLRKCIQSLRHTIHYSNIELIIVDNDSKDPETKSLLSELALTGAIVLTYPGRFNYSAICNFASEHATGSYLCFLNNDTESISLEWLGSMVDHASQPGVGIVGAVMLYPDGQLQHMGVALGHNFIAGHPFRGKSAQSNLPSECFQVSAVTFACAVVSKETYKDLGGLDESLPSGFNDVDISIRANDAHLENIVCIKSVLTHHESQTRAKTRSLRGGFRAVLDAIAFLRKHPKKLTDEFFRV